MNRPSRLDAMRRPPDLDEEEAVVWDDLAPIVTRMGLLTDETRERFAEYCRAIPGWHRARAGGDETAEMEAIDVILRRSKEFGLSPLARVELVEQGVLAPKWMPGR